MSAIAERDTSQEAQRLAEARELHGKALADVERGVDPGAVAMEAKRARKAAPTFADLCRPPARILGPGTEAVQDRR